MKLHPDFLESVPEAKDLFSGIPPNEANSSKQPVAGNQLDWCLR